MNSSIVLLYFCFLLAITLVDSKGKKGFVLSRNIYWLWLSVSIAAGLVGGNTFVTFTGFVKIYGISAMWFFIGLVLGLSTFLFVPKNLKNLNVLQNITISDYFEKIFDRSTSLYLSVANLIRFLSILAIQIIAGGKILSELLSISYTWSVIITITTITIYVYIKGFWGVVKSDIFQVFFIIVPLLFSVPSFYSHLINTDNSKIREYINPFNAGFANILVFLLFGIALIVGSADIWQRLICLKELRSIRKIVISSSLQIIIIGFLITAFGLTSINFDVDSNNAFMYIFSHGNFSEPIKIFIALAILSAILSTADTFLMGSATIIVNDFLKKKEEDQVNIYRLIIIIISLLTLLFSIYYQNILKIAIFLVNIVFTISPFIFFHMVGKKLYPISVKLSIIFGALYIIIITVFKGSEPVYTYGSLLISLFTLLLFNNKSIHLFLEKTLRITKGVRSLFL